MANKNNKGLGRGIEALFADNSVDPEAETVVDIKLEQIRPTLISHARSLTRQR